jgi:hypothetical protein
MNKFNLHIGDYSNDGHGIQRIIQMQCFAPLVDVQNAYLKLPEWLGFKFGDINGEYEEFKMNPDHANRLVELGVIRENEAKGFVDDWVSSDSMAYLFANTLNKYDPTLEVEVVEQEEKIPSFHYHQTDRNKYIGQIGYGLFGH